MMVLSGEDPPSHPGTLLVIYPFPIAHFSPQGGSRLLMVQHSSSPRFCTTEN